MNYEEAYRILEELASKYSNRYKTINIEPYQYWGKIISIVDADTFDLEIEIGFNIKVTERFRLFGINAPEIHKVKASSEEFKSGMKALEFVQELVQVGDWVEMKVYHVAREKYGRWLCAMFVRGQSLNALLLVKALAKTM